MLNTICPLLRCPAIRLREWRKRFATHFDQQSCVTIWQHQQVLHHSTSALWECIYGDSPPFTTVNWPTELLWRHAVLWPVISICTCLYLSDMIICYCKMDSHVVELMQFLFFFPRLLLREEFWGTLLLPSELDCVCVCVVWIHFVTSRTESLLSSNRKWCEKSCWYTIESWPLDLCAIGERGRRGS